MPQTDTSTGGDPNNRRFLSGGGLLTLWSKIKSWVGNNTVQRIVIGDTTTSFVRDNDKIAIPIAEPKKIVDGVEVTTSGKSGLMSIAQATQLERIVTEGGEPNVINGVKLEGDVSNLVPDSDKNVTIPKATVSRDGLMSRDDFAKLSGLPTQPQLDNLFKGKVEKVKVDGTDYTPDEQGIVTMPSVNLGSTKETTTGGILTGADYWDLQEAIISLAPQKSPNFTGTPKAPTAEKGTNTTQIATTAFVAAEIQDKLSGITSIDYKVVSSLPSTGEKGIIYLVSNSGSGTNVYDEYIYYGNKFELLGPITLDLSDYLKRTDFIETSFIEGLD